MKIEHNAPALAARYRTAAAAIRAEVEQELRGLVGRIESEMRRRAAKWRSTMATSVRTERESALSYFVGPHVDYALSVEKGRRPGKGLPRFFDPDAASIVAWLEDHPRTAGPAGPLAPPRRKARLGSARRQAAELDLRDRYMALSRHVKARGIRPHPFVKPTADAYRAEVPGALTAAVQRGAARFRESRS